MSPASHSPGPRVLSDFAGRVLDVADRIPAGQVMSYGDIAEYLGQGGPRQVGRVLALWGGGAPWWRVVHADGSLLAGHEQAALARYRAERTPLRRSADGSSVRVDMRHARWSGQGGTAAEQAGKAAEAGGASGADARPGADFPGTTGAPA
jgi:alkylated DNA nucleotide flippase Atl1